MHPIKRMLTYAYRDRDTVCLASSPRSGSTWLAQMLVELGRYDWVDEPLGMTDDLRRAGFSARTYMPKAGSSVESVMHDVIRGRVGYLRLYPRLRRRLLLKFVRLNRMLRWTVETFGIENSILLLRHPCAVISSRLELGRRENSVWARVSGVAPDVPDYLAETVESLVRPTMSVERILAINWALDHAIPLVHERPRHIYVVSYENLVRDPDRELQAICAHCGIPFRVIDGTRPSHTASPDYQRGTQLDKWRERLSPDAQNDVREVVERLLPEWEESARVLGIGEW